MFLLVCTFSYKFEIVMYVSLVVLDVIVRLLLVYWFVVHVPWQQNTTLYRCNSSLLVQNASVTSRVIGSNAHICTNKAQHYSSAVRSAAEVRINSAEVRTRK